MFRIICAVFLSSLIVSLAYGQEECTEGLIRNGFTGKLVCGETKLSPKELPGLMEHVPEANEIYQSGRSIMKAGTTPAMIGAVGLGWGIAGSILPDNGSFVSKSAGPALIVGFIGVSIGIPIVFAGNSKVKKAVEKYNEKKKTASLIPSIQYTANGIQARWVF